MQGANDERAEAYKRYVGVGSDNAVHEADRQGVTSYVIFLDQALYLAQAGNQVAIYDLSHMKSIKTQEGIQELKAQGRHNTTKLKEAEDLVHFKL